MKHLITTLFLLLFFSYTKATTYYFSSSSGDDSRTASQAKNQATPWKSLSKLNSIFSTLVPGDQVLLQRGDTFFGSIIIKKSGTASAPITVGAYGTGNKPIITSLISVSGWTSKGSGIWESAATTAGSARVGILMVNGIVQRMGRWPNFSDPNQGYRVMESSLTTTSFVDSKLSSAINWKGAEVVIRQRRWVIDCDSITSHSGTKLTFKSNSSYTPKTGWGYFIQNSVKTLDQQGEWFYNRSTKKVSMYSGNSAPSGKVEIPTAGDLVYSEKFSFVKLDNLDLRGARNSIVNLRYGSDFYITNCNLSYGVNSGVQVFYTTKVHVERNTVSNNMNSGVNFGYSPSVNSTIKNNKVTNTAIFAGMNGNGDGKGIGINTNCSNITISGNEIRNTGFIGIYFGNSCSNVMISNNYLDGFNMTKDDGGGIYTILSPVPSTLPVNRNILNNVVVNGVGALPGVWQNTGEATDGIYLDNGSANIIVSGNTVANVNHQGIFLHNAKNNTISNNTIYNTKNAISFFQNTDHPLIRNNKVTGNILFAKTASQSLITCQGPNIPLFATYSGNYFVRPSDTKNATILTLLKTFQGNAGLKTYTTASRFDFNGYSPDKAVKLDAAYINAKNVAFSGTMNLTGYTSAALIRTGSTPVPRDTAPATVDTMKIHITSPVDSFTYNAGDVINISASVVDVDSVMKHARYYANGVLIHTELIFPFSWDWKKVAAGNYEIVVQGEDSLGNAVDVSDTIHIVVAAARAAKPAVNSAVSILSLSPVPATKILTVSGISGKANILVLSIDGHTVKEMYTENRKEDINVSSLKAGVYVIKIAYKDHTESKQFIKL